MEGSDFGDEPISGGRVKERIHSCIWEKVHVSSRRMRMKKMKKVGGLCELW